MDSKIMIGAVLVTVGLLALAFSIPFYAIPVQSYGTWSPFGGMMGSGMMGGMMRGYNPNSVGGQRITFDEATQTAQTYLASLTNPDLAIDEIMEFQYNFYAIYYEKSTGARAFEMLIDPYSGQIFPEYGPNMMWNTKYGMMGGMMGSIRRSPTLSMPVTSNQAVTIADNYLKTYLPGASAEEPDVFYGYYTIHVLRDGRIYGMLSVNGYSAKVWYHDWHGAFIQLREF
jgi:hypothetical protein